MITVEQIKELRDRTGISIAQCKKALEAAGGDLDKAMADLKDQGAQVAEKKEAEEAEERKAKKQQILAIIDEKEADALKGTSIKRLREMAEAL
jgi:elongation factor Ts